jgi:hypothetical protein
MDSAKDAIAIVGGVLGLLVAVLKILELWEKVDFPAKLKRLLSSATIAWLLLAVILVGLSGYWFLASRGIFPPSTTFPLETATVKAYPYYDWENEAWSYLAVTLSEKNGKLTTRYEFDFTLPSDSGAWAGFDLHYSEPQDLTEYDFIKFAIGFGDDQARCQLCIDDISGESDCVMLGDGRIVDAMPEEQTIQIPLDTYFDSIARGFVREITFDVNDSFVQGEHSITVGEIRFAR